MNPISDYYEVIESAVAQLGIDPSTCRSEEEEGTWHLAKGDITVIVHVWMLAEGDEEVPYIMVFSPLYPVGDHLPKSFYEDLLTLNHTMVGTSFTIHDGAFMLRSVREALNIDESEMLRMLHRVGNYAEEYVPALTARYFTDAQAAPDDNM